MVKILNSIRTEVPWKRIYMRLGRHVATKIDESVKKRVDDTIKKAVLLCDSRGCYDIFSIVENDGESLLFADGTRIVSSQFCRLLGNCRRLAIFACTVGSGLVTKRDELMSESLEEAVIYDATGSEMVEECAEFLHDFIRRSVEKEGCCTLKRRYSPGYGDMSLTVQRDIFRLLDPQRVGIALTESCLMVPEKSVTAFVGIEERSE